MACAVCDPVCAPVEKMMFCGLAPMVEDGRPMLLVVGAFLGGLQFSDFLVEEAGMLAGYKELTELTVDFLTFLFFMAGCYSVYNKDKEVTGPVLRFGLAMVVVRVLHELMYMSGVPDWCEKHVAMCGNQRQATECEAEPLCEWADIRGSQFCKSKSTVQECVQQGDMHNAAYTLLPQLIAQVFYCWLLNSYAHVKAAGLLPVADDGSVPAPGTTPP